MQAVTTVQVGSQASGAISWLGADFNSQVKRGQVIARLDPSTFEAQVENARASVINAEAAVQAATSEIANQSANIQAAKANREAIQVQSKDAEAVAARYKELSNVIAGRDIESAQAQASAAAAKVVQASAQVSQAEAARQSSSARLEQAKAQLAQARAQLEQAQVGLDHTIITSPIDGVVVSRNVDVGQTVAASLQAPTLFTIANDLTKMQALASVDEADMGQVKEGINANFTVDAYPGETFSGRVSQVRLNSQNLQNVVTYTAVIEVSNPDLKLRPGMTASITFPVQQRENVLTVPNAALRFKPNLTEDQQQQLRAEMQARREQRAQGQNKQPRAEPQSAQNASATESNRPQGQTIWVLVGGKKLEPRFARAGLTNGRVTEIIAGNLQEGEIVVVGQNDGASSNTNRAQQPASPFGQQQRGGGRGRTR
jgi:HlyD family secretion protein